MPWGEICPWLAPKGTRLPAWPLLARIAWGLLTMAVRVSCGPCPGRGVASGEQSLRGNCWGWFPALPGLTSLYPQLVCQALAVSRRCWPKLWLPWDFMSKPGDVRALPWNKAEGVRWRDSPCILLPPTAIPSAPHLSRDAPSYPSCFRRQQIGLPPGAS